MTDADDRRRSVGAYARAIETALAQARGRPQVLSPRDWELVTGWYERGVPIGLVLEALEEACTRGAPPRTVAYLAPAVEEAFRVVVSGRREDVSPEAEPTPGPDAIESQWRRAASEAAWPGLRTTLEDLLRRRMAGEDPSALDAALDRALEESAPPEILEREIAEVDRALEPYRGRMGSEAFEQSRRRAIGERLRRRLHLPRLAFTVELPAKPADG